MEHTKQEHRQVVYTASIGIEALRMGLAYSSRRGHTLVTVDIKAAFLNAQLLPRNRKAAEEAVGPLGEDTIMRHEDEQRMGTEQSGKEVVALIPPRMLVTKGVFAPSDRLLVRKAVYGLDQSPRDWAFFRDATLPTLKVDCEEREYHLFQSYSEDSLWLVAETEPRRGFEATSEEEEGIEGWIVVYVDDILVAARKSLAQAVLKAISTCWE